MSNAFYLKSDSTYIKHIDSDYALQPENTTSPGASHQWVLERIK